MGYMNKLELVPKSRNKVIDEEDRIISIIKKIKQPSFTLEIIKIKAVKKYDDYPSMNIKKVLNKLVKEKYIVTHVNSKNKEITYSIPEKIDNDNLKKKIKKKKNSESSLIIEE